MLLQIALAAALLGGKCPYIYESASPECNDGDIRNGYWWDNWWVPELISDEKWRQPAPDYSYGRLVWYAPGPMAATAKFRGLSLNGYLGGVAMMSPSDIGRTVWIKPPGGDWEGPYLVVDCAQYEDEWPIVRYRKEVIEVDWATKTRWGIDKPLDGVMVIKADDPYQLWRVLETHEPLDYVGWWLGE